MLPDLEKILLADRKERARVAQAQKEAQALLDQVQIQIQSIQAKLQSDLAHLREKIQEEILHQARTLDAEGGRWQEEFTATVGTRHRSVYYLCHQVPEALGLVISHDGYVRLIKSKDGRVTYWEQANSFPLKIS